MVSLVSLKYSLAGLAMKQGTALTVRLPPGSTSFGAVAPTRLAACVPVAVAPPQGTSYRPLQIGALLVGCSGEITPELKNGLARLAAASGPALLTIGLAKVQHLGHLLSLRDADAEYIGAEEDLQDLPLEVARPYNTPLGPPTQKLDLGNSSEVASSTTEPSVHSHWQPPQESQSDFLRIQQQQHHPEVVQSRSEYKGNPSHPSAPSAIGAVDSSESVAADDSFRGTNTITNTTIESKINNDEQHNDDIQKSQFFREQVVSSSSESLAALATGTPGTGPDGGALNAANCVDTKWSDRTQSLDLEKKGSQAVVRDYYKPATISTILCFQDNPALESAFIAAEAHANAFTDAVFCTLYLVAVLCLLWTSAPVPCAAFLAMGLAASLPLAASLTALAGKGELYARCREALLAILLLVPVVLARRGGPLELVGMRLDGAVGTLPCLMRSADVLLAMVLPLGCRIRFCWLLPGQMVNMWSIFRDLPWGELRNAGLGGSCGVALTLSGALPLVITYICEVRARRRLLWLTGGHRG